MRDILLGLGWPQYTPEGTHETFPTDPVPVTRPVFDEDNAITPDYPPTVNEYDADGKLKHPSQATSGQLFDVGRAITFAEFKAMVLGQTSSTQPSSLLQHEIFRHYKALIDVLGEMEGASPLTLDQARAAWRRHFDTSTPRPSLVFWRNGETAAITATAEAAVLSLPLAAGLLEVGESAVYHLGLGAVVQGGTAALNYLFRLDGLAGTTIAAGSATEIPSSTSGEFILTLTRRADVGGLAVFAVTVQPNLGVADTTAIVGNSGVISLNHALDHEITFTAYWSAGTNSAKLLYAYGERK